MGEETSQILSLWLLLLKDRKKKEKKNFSPTLSTTHQFHQNLASVPFLRNLWPALVKILGP